MSSRSARAFIRCLAYLTPMTALPSALWRLLTLAGLYGPMHPVTLAMRSATGDVLLISFGSVALLALTIGLVRPWGERLPARLPLIGSRPVPRWLALAPAYAGGATLTALAGYVLARLVEMSPDPDPVQLRGADLLVVQMCYAPLLAAGPLLLIVARDYQKRTAPAGL